MEDSLMFDLNRIAVGGYPTLMFINQIFQRGLTETAAFDCSSLVSIDEVLKKLDLGDVKIITHNTMPKRPNNYRDHFIDMEHTILSISHSGDFMFSVAGASKDRKALDELMGKMLALLPPLRAKADNIIPITYWALAGGTAVRRVRYGTVPIWNDSLALNYAGSTRDELSSLMAIQPPIVAGRMLLWHGVPGTGKSYMVRTLAQNWGKWCVVHYIVDPERFLGDANYMLSVIFDSEEVYEKAEAQPAVVGSASSKSEVDTWKKHQLIIMEDANEFLGVDAKERTGQSLSRLLNMADGLVGQELNLLILITTNEPIEKIHPAIKRHGRCLSNIEFGTLSVAESEAWLREHKAEMDRPLMDGATVAELYAQSREQKQVATKTNTRSMGFVRS